MNNIMDKAYYRLPIALQNIAVSAMGWKLSWQRKTKESLQFVEFLKQSQYWSQDRMQEYQAKQLKNIVDIAINTKSYGDWKRRSNFDVCDIRGIESLALLPITDKESVRSHPQDFVANIVSRGNRFKLSTSGTSGTPLSVYTDRRSRARHYAFFSRLRSWFGVSDSDWRATFYGRIIMKSESTKPPFWRVDYPQRNLLFSSYHISEETILDYVRALEHWKPAAVLGYPSSLHALATLANAKGISLPRPKMVMTTAETLLDHQRENIEMAFGVPVTDQYGATEMTHFVSQCERGAYHVHAEHGVVEILDQAGQPVPVGEIGEVVVTGFMNRTMPLLRYRTGDTAAADGRKCDCGRPFPVLARIEGRMDDVIVTPEGRSVGRLDPVLKGDFDIRETQFVQVENGTLLVKVVPGSHFEADQVRRLEQELRKRLGESMIIKFDVVSHIPRGKNGKFRSVIASTSMQHIRS